MPNCVTRSFSHTYILCNEAPSPRGNPQGGRGLKLVSTPDRSPPPLWLPLTLYLPTPSMQSWTKRKACTACMVTKSPQYVYYYSSTSAERLFVRTVLAAEYAMRPKRCRPSSLVFLTFPQPHTARARAHTHTHTHTQVFGGSGRREKRSRVPPPSPTPPPPPPPTKRLGPPPSKDCGAGSITQVWAGWGGFLLNVRFLMGMRMI